MRASSASFASLFNATLLALLIVAASEVFAHAIVARSPTEYAPRNANNCPKPLIRHASDGSHSADEMAFVKTRKQIAGAALTKWFQSTNASFDTSGRKPTLALATSGGGLRAFLTGAGVHQALDSNEKTNSTLSGLYQSLTYESGLSGGGWFLLGLAGNNWPTVTSWKNRLLYRSLTFGLTTPDQAAAPAAEAEIVASIASKAAAGYDPTFVDSYARDLGYAFLYAHEGGVGQTLSSIQQQPKYQARSIPFPLVTSVQAKPISQGCTPMSPPNATQFEFSPVEFGSYDSEWAAFVPTKDIGSTSSKCINNYDNLGYVMGTTSDIFTEGCELNAATNPQFMELQNFTLTLEKSLPGSDPQPILRDLYAVYPNSFANQTAQPGASNARRDVGLEKRQFDGIASKKDNLTNDELYLIDGGFSGQVIPIWPFVYRKDVDVLFANDNNADLPDNFPNGSSIRATYLEAQGRGLTRMPFIPDPSVFVAKGYNKRPTFFGCPPANLATGSRKSNNGTLLIIYQPNAQYTFNSGTETFQLNYPPQEVDAMNTNGQHVATGDGHTQGLSPIATCVGCAIQSKSNKALPAACQQCFKDYCYYP